MAAAAAAAGAHSVQSDGTEEEEHTPLLGRPARAVAGSRAGGGVGRLLRQARPEWRVLLLAVVFQAVQTLGTLVRERNNSK